MTDARWNTTVTTLASLSLGIVAALSIVEFAPPADRQTWARWLYDWQSLVAGMLALLAAAITAPILWKQLKEAEKQALLATRDGIKRDLSAFRDLQFQISSLSNSIGDIELSHKTSDENMDMLGKLRSLMVDRVLDIERSARAVGIDVSSQTYKVIKTFCDFALDWSIVARRIQQKARVPISSEGDASIRHTRDLQVLFKEAHAIREKMLKPSLQASAAIERELLPFRRREAELTAIMLQRHPGDRSR